MKLFRFLLRGYRQFQHFEIDLTYPAGHRNEGQPLEKCCFLGRNGTGKSTLLQLLFNFLANPFTAREHLSLAAGLCLKERRVYLFHDPLARRVYCFPGEAENTGGLEECFAGGNRLRAYAQNHEIRSLQEIDPIKTEIHFAHNQKEKLLLYAPPESQKNSYYGINDVPYATLNDALPLLRSFNPVQTISPENISDFWKQLIALIKERESLFRDFEEKEENQEKTVRQVREEFDQKNPKILEELAKLWDRILEKADLEFDLENAKNPIQLSDNLKAYIRLKSKKEKIQYDQLSTGIRNFIFRLGHIFSLYFQRQVQTGFLLIDEPENSLFPDFLYDLIELYQSIVENTQIFMATHNPIIAAQFEPSERFILDFQEDGSVTSRRGSSPEGDDPNDLLVKDFLVRNLYGKEGLRQWERFAELQTLIQKAKTWNEKKELMKEYMKIGTAYNFPAETNEKPSEELPKSNEVHTKKP